MMRRFKLNKTQIDTSHENIHQSNPGPGNLTDTRCIEQKAKIDSLLKESSHPE
jgi:hypothetical protein